MHATALIRIRPSGPAPRAALRVFLAAARRLCRAPGFRNWQTFRTLAAPDELQVVLDFDSERSLRAALGEAIDAATRAQAARWGFAVDPPEIFLPRFDRRLSPPGSTATLLRVGRRAEGERDLAERDSRLALQAVAAPGTVRLSGARSDAGAVLCRIDFDTEDGLYHFLESPLRKRWSTWHRQGFESESWLINLPRLEGRRPAAAKVRRTALPPPGRTLSMEVSHSEDGRHTRIRLEGTMDGPGAECCERVCAGLLRGGCTGLEVDVSGVRSISSEALGMLTRVARSLKERGGRFILTDNEDRVRRVTRSKHLEASIR